MTGQPMPSLWSTDDVNGAFYYMRWFIGANNMWIMIIVAICIAGSVASLIVFLMQKALGQNKDDDDDEDDIYY